ncbi:MAG: 2-amino-4-hydroxy-6-hydroxymethyldihydropteridine diphosphokinase [Rhodothermales bacterium]|nr:2-amino-4-hydroxy-6-hydroxymethyldihydropteridine diphosphokinase [Rhodothermales bacterium]
MAEHDSGGGRDGEHGAKAYLGLGANLGDRIGALQQAVTALREQPGILRLRASPVYESAAHTLDPEEAQPPFLNAVVEVETTLSPEALLAVAHALERAAGRTRRRRWAPRTLDVDLLVYGAVTRSGPGIAVPHPRLGARRFVLQPLADLAPNLRVPPPFDAPAAVLLRRCPDEAPLARTPYSLLDDA